MSNELLIAALRHAAYTAVARYDALVFVVIDGAVGANHPAYKTPAVVEAEIALVHALPPVPTAGHYPTSSHVYRRVYSDALRDIQPRLIDPQPELYVERYWADGYQQALFPALEQQGHVDTLLREIERLGAFWHADLETMLEGAVMRVHAEGARAGFDKALVIIDAVEAGDTLPVAYPPDWFTVRALPQINQLLSLRGQHNTAETAYRILKRTEGDLWRLERESADNRLKQDLAGYRGDKVMQTYLGNVVAYLEQGQAIIAACMTGNIG